MVKQKFVIRQRTGNKNRKVRHYSYEYDELKKLQRALEESGLSSLEIVFNFPKYKDVEESKLEEFGLKRKPFDSCRLRGMLKGNKLEIFISNNTKFCNKAIFTRDFDDFWEPYEIEFIRGCISSDASKEDFELVRNYIRSFVKRDEEDLSPYKTKNYALN